MATVTPIAADFTVDGRRVEVEVLVALGRNLVGFAEIAERHGTTPGTVRQWSIRHADFPAPVATLATGRVWFWPEVERWLRSRAASKPKSAPVPGRHL